VRGQVLVLDARGAAARCNVTGVVTVVSLPRVLGVLTVIPAVRLWALGAAYVRTSFEVIAEMVAVRVLSVYCLLRSNLSKRSKKH